MRLSMHITIPTAFVCSQEKEKKALIDQIDTIANEVQLKGLF